MSDSVRIRMSLEAAENESFSPKKLESNFDAYAPTAGTYRYEVRKVSAATGGTTVDLGMYTTVLNIIVKNKDTTNRVDGTFRTTGGSSNNQVLSAPAGGMFATGSRVTVANDLVLTADTAACECEVAILAQ